MNNEPLLIRVQPASESGSELESNGSVERAVRRAMGLQSPNPNAIANPNPNSNPNLIPNPNPNPIPNPNLPDHPRRNISFFSTDLLIWNYIYNIHISIQIALYIARLIFKEDSEIFTLLTFIIPIGTILTLSRKLKFNHLQIYYTSLHVFIYYYWAIQALALSFCIGVNRLYYYKEKHAYVDLGFYITLLSISSLHIMAYVIAHYVNVCRRVITIQEIQDILLNTDVNMFKPNLFTIYLYGMMFEFILELGISDLIHDYDMTKLIIYIAILVSFASIIRTCYKRRIRHFAEFDNIFITPIVTQQTLENMDLEDNQCVICLVAYVPGDYVSRLPCEHRFHRACINPWLSNNNTCPTCRAAIVTNDE